MNSNDGPVGSGDPPADAPSAPVAAVVARVLSVPHIALQVLGLILVLAALLWALRRLEGVLLLIVLSIFFAYLIAPLVALVRRPIVLRGRSRSIPLSAAIGAVYALILGVVALAVWFLLPVASTQFEELVGAAPGYLAKAQAQMQSWQRYERMHIPKGMRDAFGASVDQTIKEVTDGVQGGVLPFVREALGYLPWLVLVPIVALFLLKDADVFRKTALRMVPRTRLRWHGDDFFRDVNSTLAAYVRTQLIACLIVGVACAVGFALIGVPYAVVLGILAGLFEFIPLAGPLAIAALAIVFAAFHSGGEAGATLVFLVALRIVEDYVIYPRIIGRGMRLHPLAIILAILCGAELAGIPGIFLSIPVVAIASVAFRHWQEHRAKDV